MEALVAMRAEQRMRNGVGRERTANPNSPARLSPGFNPQKFPSASGALGTWATKGCPLGRINTSSVRGSWVCIQFSAAAILWTLVSKGREGPRPVDSGAPVGRRMPAICWMWLCGCGPAGIHLPPSTGQARAALGPHRSGPWWLPPSSHPCTSLPQPLQTLKGRSPPMSLLPPSGLAVARVPRPEPG